MMKKSLFLMGLLLIATGIFYSSCKKDDNKCKVETHFNGVWYEPGYPDETLTINGNTITITDGTGYTETATWTLGSCDGNNFSGTVSGNGFNDIVNGVFINDNTMQWTIAPDTFTLVRI